MSARYPDSVAVDATGADRAALTESAYGRGIGYYLATLPDAAAARRITTWLAEAAGVRPVLADLPPRVEAARRGEVVTRDQPRPA